MPHLDGERAREVGGDFIEEDERLVIKLLVDKQSQPSHHSSASVQEFLGSELGLVSLGGSIPSETDRGGAARHIAREGSLLLLEDNSFKNTTDGENGDQEVCGWDFQDGLVSRREVGTSRESVLGVAPGGGVSKKCHHSNTAILQLRLSKTVELLFVSVDKVKRIPHTESRAGNADIIVEGRRKGGCCLGLLGRSESGGSADKSEKGGSSLHFGYRPVCNVRKPRSWGYSKRQLVS